MALRRVLLAGSTPMSFAVLKPVAEALSADPRIELRATTRHGGARAVAQALGRTVRVVPWVAARFLRFDLTLCPGFSFRPLRAGLSVQVFHGVSPKNYAVSDETLRFDRLHLIGEYHRGKLVARGLLGDDDARGLKIGMPKTDPLVREPARNDGLLTELGLDPSLPCVAYAPTRSGSAGSSLEHGGLEAIARVARLPVNVLVKLHDRSRKEFRRKLRVDYRAAIRELERRHPRLRLVETADVIPVLRAADLLVSDLSSAAMEYLLRDRPVVFLAAPRHEERLRRAHATRFPGDPEDLDHLRACGELARDANRAVEAVERGLADPAARRSARRELARRLFYNHGVATEAAVAAILRDLDLAPASP